MRPRTGAFTLIELLTSIGIILVLMGLVAVGLRGVRATATRADSLNSVRQMALAYSSYANEHRQRLLPGYIGAELFGDGQPFGDLSIKEPDGVDEMDDLDKQSYVWRLAPYVDHVWQTFFTDMNSPGLLSDFQDDYHDGEYGPFGDVDEGGISERPSYGMNSIFVGGDSVHGGTYAVERNPWTPAAGVEDEIFAATRLSEVKNPTKLIVFGPAAKASAAGTGSAYEDDLIGFCELRPPFFTFDGTRWSLPQWTVGANGQVETTPGGEYTDPPGAGLPIARSGDLELMPVSMLDGSTNVEKISDLSRDMRRWSPFEVATNPTDAP